MSDRKLDEAVAMAMGWRNKSTGWVEPKFGAQTMRYPRSYSTDPATQAEMLAWLQDRGSRVELVWNEDELPAWGAWMAPRSKEQSGATINEALARLVVAVAESEAKP